MRLDGYAGKSDLRTRFPLLFGSSRRATGLADAVAAIDPAGLTQEYTAFQKKAPRRSAAGRPYFVGHSGITASQGKSNRAEEHYAVALLNLGRYWPLPEGGWFRFIDYQVPLKARQGDAAIGKVDLLAVTGDGRLMITELKVDRDGKARGDSPLTALMEGLRYAAAAEADMVALATEAELRFGTRITQRTPVIALLAPREWWDGWIGTAAAGRWEVPFGHLTGALRESLGVEIVCLATAYEGREDIPLQRVPSLHRVTLGLRAEIDRELVLPRSGQAAATAYKRDIDNSLWQWADKHHTTELDGGTRSGRSPVLGHESAVRNVLVPEDERLTSMIRSAIDPKRRHRHFASLRSSQALAQSVFASIRATGRLDILSGMHAECGRPAFFTKASSWEMALEHDVDTLGEPRPTSIDVLLSSPGYRIAVECKFTESEFGTCSRPRLRPGEPAYDSQRCDGSYQAQAGRSVRCALSGIGVRYWDYLPSLFAWQNDRDYLPCPLAATYQLARNALAALVNPSVAIDPTRGHVLVVYDANNPAFRAGGSMTEQWEDALASCVHPGLLRRTTWQRLLAAMDNAPELSALTEAIREKYSLT